MPKGVQGRTVCQDGRWKDPGTVTRQAGTQSGTLPQVQEVAS